MGGWRGVGETGEENGKRDSQTDGALMHIRSPACRVNATFIDLYATTSSYTSDGWTKPLLGSALVQNLAQTEGNVDGHFLFYRRS